ncbi:MAG: MMPL family transporter [Pseudomonadota bacterium]
MRWDDNTKATFEGRDARMDRFDRNLESWLARPWAVLCAALLFIVLAGFGLARVEKDPSVDAFVPGDHPAAINRDLARDTFGLEDPVIVGLLVPDGETVFTPDRLDALRRLDAGVRSIDGVQKNDVISLASQNAIAGNDGDLIVDPIIQAGQISPQTALLARQRFQAMPMLSGLLVSGDGTLATLIIPVDDPNHAEDVVAAISAMAEAEAAAHFNVHVAGVAAMNARLASMVDSDTRIFVPAAVLTVLLILYVALRRPAALLGPLLVIAGSAAIAIGVMGWLGANYYLITTALPVVIMAIAVADALHICTYYLSARGNDLSLDAKAAVVHALEKAWLPITLTSITTIAAFIGLSFGAAMKPISEFGLFAALGVAAAWALSLTALPAILILTDLKHSSASSSVSRVSFVDRAIAACTNLAFQRPVASLGALAITTLALAAFASQAEFDYERQRYFTESDPVKIADREINVGLGGVNFLDVVVTAPEPGGLMTPEALASIRSLRGEISALGHVEKVSGIDEYIALMHGVLTGAPEGTLPSSQRGPAQYMFLYEASAPPEDFKQEIDFDHTRALIRAQLSTDSYSRTLPTVEALEDLAERWSKTSGLSANISGRVAVNDGWMTQLADNHFRGLGLAVALVFITTVLVFRSLVYAVLAMVPVLVGVVSVYATMGAFGIDIAPATSMTAAIATGLGIDFGIHLISLVRNRQRAGQIGQDVFRGNYPIVARACFYSAVALGVALAVICISSAPPLRWFGFLVSVGAFGSLIGALVIVPALWAVTSLFTQGEQRNATL